MTRIIPSEVTRRLFLGSRPLPALPWSSLSSTSRGGDRQFRYGLYLADLSHRQTNSHGIVNYALGLAKALLSELRKDEHLVLFVNDEILEALLANSSWPSDNPPEMHILRVPRNKGVRLWRDHIAAPMYAVGTRVHLLHFPKGFIPFPKLGTIKIAATVHDDIPCRYSEGTWGASYANHQSKYFSLSIRHAVHHADHIITVSEFSRQRLEALHTGNRKRPISVTYQGITLPQRSYIPVANRSPHILHIGSPLPHKRSHWGISILLRYLDEANSRLRLRILGNLDDQAETAATHPRVDRIRRQLTNEDIATEMVKARALLFPSEYEGFGLPPVEALCLGTPSIYARTSAVAEILEDIPGGYSPGNEASFRQAVDEAMQIGDRRLKRIQSQMLNCYSWRKVGQRTLEIYRSIAGGG